MSRLVTNGLARDVTTCHVVTSRHVTRPRDTPLSALRCQIVSAEEKWRRDPGSEIFTGPAGLLAPAPPSPAVLPPRGLICQTAGRCRAEQSGDGAMTRSHSSLCCYSFVLDSGMLPLLLVWCLDPRILDTVMTHFAP